jgi:hypothetical protein
MRIVLVTVCAIALSACISVEVNDEARVAQPPLCDGARQVGRVVVVPTVSWRSDQKEPELREAMIEAALARAFGALSCGEVLEVRSVVPAATLDRQALFEVLRSQDVATAIEIDFTELGPLLIVSIPVLVSTKSDIQFTLSATKISSDTPLFELDRDWKRGGPFVIRPASVLADDLVLALADVLEP